METSSDLTLLQNHIKSLYSSLSRYYSYLSLIYAFASSDKKLKSTTCTEHGRHPDHSDYRLQTTTVKLKEKIHVIEREVEFFKNNYLG